MSPVIMYVCILKRKQATSLWCFEQAVTNYNDPKIIAEVSSDLGEPMVGIDCRQNGFTSYAERSE